MLKLISKLLKVSATFIYKLADKIEVRKEVLLVPDNSLQVKRFKPWFRDNGDRTHRLVYNLNENSIVFDLGGYEGEWAAQIFCLYDCSLFIFEPYEKYFQNIQNKFLRNKKVKVFQFGLAKKNEFAKLALADNSSSVFHKSENSADVELVCANDFFNQQHIQRIDLMKINIEGGEYALLEHLIETGDVKKIHNIQVQFHDFIEDAESRMKAIQQDLHKTHELTYQYEFVWENWKLKSE